MPPAIVRPNLGLIVPICGLVPCFEYANCPYSYLSAAGVRLTVHSGKEVESVCMVSLASKNPARPFFLRVTVRKFFLSVRQWQVLVPVENCPAIGMHASY